MTLQKQTFLAEKYLMDMLDKIYKNRNSIEEYSAIYVAVSRLKPKNRHPSFINVLAHFFDGVVSGIKASFLKLQNSDFIIIGEKLALKNVNDALHKIKQGFASDPLIHKDSFDEFAKVYKFPEDFQTFVNFVEDAIFNISAEHDVVEVQSKTGLDAGNFEVIYRQLEGMNFSEIIRRQGCFNYSNGEITKTNFQEFFFAVKDLNAKIGDGDFDLMKNKWMFLYLSTFLDKKILSSFFGSNITKWPNFISINLNLTTIFTKEFVEFAKEFLKSHQKIIVETKLIDVLNNIDSYLEARDILRKGGNGILIDEVPLGALKMINFQQLDADNIKLFWEPLMEYEDNNARLKKTITQIGSEKIVLAKCDSQKAVDWGLKYGISNFQGPYLDELEVKQIMERCPKSETCNKENCMRLRKQTSNLYFDGCSSKNVFEDYL